MNQLQEEVTLNEIQATVAQARLGYQASEFGDAEARGTAAESYLEVLEKAAIDADVWEEAVQQKIEQVPSGRTSSRGRLPITHPKAGDPYYKLLQAYVPFLLELRKERDSLRDGLAQHHN